MPKYIKIENNFVIQTQPFYSEGFIQASDDVFCGMFFDGKDFVVPVVNKTPEELQKEIVDGVQLRLDAFAKTRNYDGILSACTYATSVNPKFKAEGQYCVEARDNTWASLYQILEDVQEGIRPAPSGYQDIEPELPILTWPS